MAQDSKIWESCFNGIETGLKEEPIHYKDSHNLLGEVFLKELYENSHIDFEDGLDTLVDLIAYLVDKNGFVITKK